MFTAMFLIPTFYGPAVGQWSLHVLGELGFFGLAAVPMVIALVLTRSLYQTEAVVSNASGYLILLRDRRLWLPNLATAMSGLAYAFAFSFLPLLLAERSVAVAAFFTPFAVVLLLVRFVGLKYLQRLSPAALVASGLLAYASGLFGFIAPVWFIPSLGGVLFAFGYGVILPTCITWSTSHFTQAERARPVALINTSFNLGSILAVQATGALIPVIGWPGALLALGATIGAVFASLPLWLWLSIPLPSGSRRLPSAAWDRALWTARPMINLSDCHWCHFRHSFPPEGPGIITRERAHTPYGSPF
jgi:MFS family permease